jgi:hypothetical protein
MPSLYFNLKSDLVLITIAGPILIVSCLAPLGATLSIGMPSLAIAAPLPGNHPIRNYVDPRLTGNIFYRVVALVVDFPNCPGL